MRPECRGGVGYVQRRWCLGLLSGPAPRWLRRPSPGVFRNAGPRSHVIRGEHPAECVRDRGGWGAAAGRGRGWDSVHGALGAPLRTLSQARDGAEALLRAAIPGNPRHSSQAAGGPWEQGRES